MPYGQGSNARIKQRQEAAKTHGGYSLQARAWQYYLRRGEEYVRVKRYYKKTTM